MFPDFDISWLVDAYNEMHDDSDEFIDPCEGCPVRKGTLNGVSCGDCENQAQDDIPY